MEASYYLEFTRDPTAAEFRGFQAALFRAYLKQILVDGMFHADPHPGNVLLTIDHRIALLDLGMVGHTTPTMQENLLKLLLAISEGESDEAVDVAKVWMEDLWPAPRPVKEAGSAPPRVQEAGA